MRINNKKPFELNWIEYIYMSVTNVWMSVKIGYSH